MNRNLILLATLMFLLNFVTGAAPMQTTGLPPFVPGELGNKFENTIALVRIIASGLASDHPWVEPTIILTTFRSLKISPADEAKILSGNARKLFNI